MAKRSRTHEGESGKIGSLAKSALVLTGTASIIGAADVTQAHINQRQTRTGAAIHRLISKGGVSFAEAIKDRNGETRDDIFRITDSARSIIVANGIGAGGKKTRKSYRIPPGALTIDIGDAESLAVVRDRTQALSRCPALVGIPAVVVRFSVPVADLTQEEKADLQKLGVVIGEYKNSPEAVIVGWIPSADKGTGVAGGVLALFLLQVGAILGRAYQRRKGGLTPELRDIVGSFQEVRGLASQVRTEAMRLRRIIPTEEIAGDEGRRRKIELINVEHGRIFTEWKRLVEGSKFGPWIMGGNDAGLDMTQKIHAVTHLQQLLQDLGEIEEKLEDLNQDDIQAAPVVPTRPDNSEAPTQQPTPVAEVRVNPAPRVSRVRWPRPDKALLRWIARFNRTRRPPDDQ